MNRTAVGAIAALAVCAGLVLAWRDRVEPAPVPVPAPAPAPAPVVVERAPEFVFAPCAPRSSPAAVPEDPALARARAALLGVVEAHGRDPENPWALVHGLLALGPEMRLADGRPAIPWLFEAYAEARPVGGERLIGFPASRGEIRIEPHTDLVLKGLTEIGIGPDATWLVQGEPATLSDLYRHSLSRTWIAPGGSGSARSFNDTPWTLQAIAAWAPPGLAWSGPGGRAMTLDALTDAVVADLRVQTAFMRDAMARGERVEKRKQGIFAYTCGGAHMLQGAAHAVARGFGNAESRASIEAEVPVLFWRLDLELGIYDALLTSNPEYTNLLLEQRLKFLGHFLESAHKLAASGLFTPDAAQVAALARAREELVATVDRLVAEGHFARLDALRADPRTYQTYLDFVGDAAHAVRGIELAVGRGTVCL